MNQPVVDLQEALRDYFGFNQFKDEQEAIIQKMIALIQDVPITGYLRAKGAEIEQKKEMRSLLQDYRQQLLEAVEFMHAKGEAIPPTVEEALAHINNTLYHFI